MDYLETIKLYEYGKIDTDELVRCVNEKVDSFELQLDKWEKDNNIILEPYFHRRGISINNRDGLCEIMYSFKKKYCRTTHTKRRELLHKTFPNEDTMFDIEFHYGRGDGSIYAVDLKQKELN